MKQARGKKEYEKEHAVQKVNEPAAAYVSKPVTNLLSKSMVINSVKDLPNNFTIDELIERVLFMQSMEKTGLSATQLAELNKRVQNHKKGKTKNQPWKTSLKVIRKELGK